jgi:hypothetical protein
MRQENGDMSARDNWITDRYSRALFDYGGGYNEYYSESWET